jgi:hypothetical protein
VVRLYVGCLQIILAITVASPPILSCSNMAPPSSSKKSSARNIFSANCRALASSAVVSEIVSPPRRDVLLLKQAFVAQVAIEHWHCVVVTPLYHHIVVLPSPLLVYCVINEPCVRELLHPVMSGWRRGPTSPVSREEIHGKSNCLSVLMISTSGLCWLLRECSNTNCSTCIVFSQQVTRFRPAKQHSRGGNRLLTLSLSVFLSGKRPPSLKKSFHVDLVLSPLHYR